ncbi:hypothetical protein P691DRAFT_721093 [Macrolepiota fuliginosa MF-IS2]|uniref:histone acetyltransferase n=1 Tax=Macrolepiota fuliginosa MF-IS2 TaxID=1400762 RepID=A0A9P5XKV3_9AGAR|nr:hypothetical protein P691DRAFT_721093 [Macrolepiota fuliginosa MF-IS2]
MTLWPAAITPPANATSSPETRSQQSNALSPASPILSDPPPSSPRAPKKRQLSSSSLSDADDNRDDDDEQPLASRVATSSTSRPRRSGKSGKGGKKNPAMKKKAHTAPTSLAPPIGDEQAQMNGRINGMNGREPKVKVEDKLDEGQLNRLAAGVPVDATRETGAPAKAEKAAVTEMRRGIIQITPVENDGQPRSWIILTGLKTLFQKQLPKMPREYIARLVYDSNSRGLAIIKRGYKIVGGICYRPFPHRGFAEIVFFATNSADQVKGYGGMLMDHFKAHVRTAYPDMLHFLTYADNYAVGYFEKQGFSKDITLDRSVWAGYIKDYEGGTIMQCTMLQKVDYLNKPALLAKQKEAILTKIKRMSRSHIVYPGLPQFQHGQPDGVVLDPKDVPGLRETGWSHGMMANIVRQSPRNADRAFMETTLNDLIRHPRSWPFRAPVDGNDVPDYYEVVKNPMDFKTMGEKLKAGKYKSIDAFVRDVQLIIDNCKSYNPESTVYYKNADRLEEAFQELMTKRPS